MSKEYFIIFFLLLLNGFFALSEMAIISSSKPLLKQYLQQGNKKAAAALRLAEDPGRFLSAVQVGMTLIGILAGAYGGATIAASLGPVLDTIPFIAPRGNAIAVTFVVGVITYFSVVIGELVPKQLALRYPEKLAMQIAMPMIILTKICTPVAIALEISARGLLRVLGATSENENAMTQAEMKAVIAEGLASGLIRHDENKMLTSILDLVDVTVEEVMTHRKNIEMLDSSLPLEVLIDKALTSHYTRIPLYQEKPENIVGILHTKLLVRQLRQVQGTSGNIDITAAISEPWFLPETTNLLDQLKAFRSKKEYFAIVVDEYGSLLGLVTREDILEEIIGRMQEDSDTAQKIIADQANTPATQTIVEGSRTIRELNREFDWNLPSTDYATVAGLILYEARDLPQVGQSFEFYDFRFDILERQRNQITSVRVTPIKNDTQAA